MDVPFCKPFQNPFFPREGAQRPSYAQVRTIKTRLFVVPLFQTRISDFFLFLGETRFIQPGETSTANKNILKGFRDLWLRDRINIAESKVSWRKHGHGCVSYTRIPNRV